MLSSGFIFFWFCFLFVPPFIFISWRLITLQYCSGFCHTLTWISHGFTCIPHPNSPSHLPLYPIPLGLPSGPGVSTCLMHPTWADDMFHPRLLYSFNAVLAKHSTLAFSHRVQKSVLYICVFFFFCFAYRVIVTIFLNSIYICVSILYWSLSFWLTSLCIMGSSFIHLIRTDSNAFFLMAE